MKSIKPFKYFPHTEEDIKIMLEKIGVTSIDDLFSDIDVDIKTKDVDIDSALSEEELRKKIIEISQKNKQLTCFCGNGSYDVYTPSIVDALSSRQEFLTSYTPYQAEISQGTLQYIFEYQSIVCELTGMDTSNASMYDGATALAESITMACTHTRRSKVLISNTVNSNYLEVVKTYAQNKNHEIIVIDELDFVYDKDKLNKMLDNTIACVVFSYPNCYGYIEEYDFLDKLQEYKIKFILSCDISSLSVLKTPFELGADIACGDCQTLGLPKSFGGPYVGFIACKQELTRKLPGRIVGMTCDSENSRGYVLTLQAREQHIRREKANSNICSNQSLMALMVTIYASVMGKAGLIETQQRCYQNSHYLKERLLESELFLEVKKNNKEDFLKEFVLKSLIDVDKMNQLLEEKGYLGGYHLNNNLVCFCSTETKTKSDIDEFVNTIISIGKVLGEVKNV